ncbi:MAG: tryptophan--tRNA ligase [Candidatus Cloacimonetes bacterium]|nr:tryptophan--tRNA ligase [Candidatus Cloacimonadota bacterium]
MRRKIACTGIKPTGVPHIGNYFGMYKPALELAKEYDTRYFIADYHALNSVKDPAVLKKNIYEVTATWLACGLDPETQIIYKQSDVPWTFELSTMLMAFTPKGLMNRAHAYKAMVQANTENGKDPDNGVNVGLFTYPILMAADILQFDSDVVPVGKDQVQHLEMAVDIAEAINRNYGKELLTIPKGVVRKETGLVIGMDGRKMSKSYNNTIPLFLPARKLRKLVMKIVTNSQTIDEPKNPDECNVFTLYKLFANEEQQEALRRRYLAGGMGWGTAKQELFEVMDAYLAPMRQKYEALMADTAYMETVLRQGAEKAAAIVSEKMTFLRAHMGM